MANGPSDDLPKARAEHFSYERLRLRDYLILLLISGATVLALGILAEESARFLFPTRSDTCKSPSSGTDFVPNCTSFQKIAEGPFVVNHYNECGYFSAESCGPKPPNALRVAVIGSSISRGYGVPYAESFAARTTVELSKRCRRPVEFQNLGMAWPEPAADVRNHFSGRINDAFELSADVIMFVVSAWDMWKFRSDSVALTMPDQAQFKGLPFYDLLHAMAETFRELREGSRAVLVLRHLIDLDSDTFVRGYLSNGDESDYLRRPLTKAWLARLNFIDLLLKELSSKAAEKGVPVIVVFVPPAAQVILATHSNVDFGLDPFALDREIAAIAAKNGADYIDLLEQMRQARHPLDMYYLVDGHPNALGHAAIAAAAESGLLMNSGFASCNSTTDTSALGARHLK
jgi:hypothetical protein